MSESPAKQAKTTEMKRVLVFGGKTGWIGNLMCELIEKEGAYTEHCVCLTGSEHIVNVLTIKSFSCRRYRSLSSQQPLGKSRSRCRRT
jgi:hypothetical protein